MGVLLAAFSIPGGGHGFKKVQAHPPRGEGSRPKPINTPGESLYSQILKKNLLEDIL